jgi:hypothetical protein
MLANRPPDRKRRDPTSTHTHPLGGVYPARGLPMSHPAVIVVVRGKKARAYTDRWLGARALDLLADGPNGCTAAVEHLAVTGTLPRWPDAGWLADLDRRTLLWFGDPMTTYIAEEEAERLAPDMETWRARALDPWRGYAVQEAEGEEAFSEHLRRRGLSLYLEPDEQVEELQEQARALDGESPSAAALAEEEASLPEVAAKVDPPDGRHPPGFRLVWAAFVVLLPVALLVRLVTLPFRKRIQAATQRAFDRQRAAVLSGLIDASNALDASPDDADLRFARGLWALQAGFAALAERDFDAIVRRGNAGGETGKASPAIALHNRGVARAKMSLPRLAERDRARAEALGLTPRKAERPPLAFAWFGFKAIAGFIPD